VRGRNPNQIVRALRSPVVRSRRLDLTLPDRRRTAEIVRLLNDPTIARWTLHIPHPYRPRDAQQFFRRWRGRQRTGRVLSLHVVRRRDGALVGGLGLHDIDAEHLRAEVGYWLGRPFRHQGYAREAVEALCQFAFHRLGLRRIEAGTFPGNRASAAVLRATAFRREGLMREAVRKGGHPVNVILYARLGGDRASSRSGSRRRPSDAPTR